MKETTRLFGNKTKKDWMEIRSKLISDFNNEQTWKEVSELFNLRLESRYFQPIDCILDMKTTSGEGFAVMTLICSLIEFLESSYQGKIYNFSLKKETKFEYKDPGQKFKKFLTGHEPFKAVFSKEIIDQLEEKVTLADDFYSNVRCGLLHEAATKNGWVIKTQSKNNSSNLRCVIFEGNQKIIYRDLFFEEIKKYVCNYLQEIKNGNIDGLREKLCRKIDSLAEIKNGANWWIKKE